MSAGRMVIMIKYYIVKILKKLKWSAIKDSRIHKNAYISGGNVILYSEIGKYTYTSYDTQILYANIGNYCSIATNCKIGGASHPLNWVSTSPMFHNGKNVFGKHFAENLFEPYEQINIGNDVWIGQDVLIKSGVNIGNGAVIGMGAVVTKDVGPYEIWGGNPAKFIRKRFDDETIKCLEETQWWLWSDDKLRKYGHAFADINQFLDAAQSEGKK